MKKKKLAPPKHGGTRIGSGRPATSGRKSPLSVRLTPEVHEFLESILTSEKPPQSDNTPSRSAFIDSAVRATSEFKTWSIQKKSKK